MIASSVIACLQTKHYASASAVDVDGKGLLGMSNCHRQDFHRSGGASSYPPTPFLCTWHTESSRHAREMTCNVSCFIQRQSSGQVSSPESHDDPSTILINHTLATSASCFHLADIWQTLCRLCTGHLMRAIPRSHRLYTRPILRQSCRGGGRGRRLLDRRNW